MGIHYLSVQYKDPDFVDNVKFWKKASKVCNQVLADCPVIDEPQFEKDGFYVRVALDGDETIGKAKQISKALYALGVKECEVMVSPRKMMAVVNLRPMAIHQKKVQMLVEDVLKKFEGSLEIATEAWPIFFIRLPITSGNPWEANCLAEKVVKMFDEKYFNTLPKAGHSCTPGQHIWKRNVLEEKEIQLRGCVKTPSLLIKKPRL